MSWKEGVCACCCGEECSTWCLACLFPCIVYSRNVADMKKLNIDTRIPSDNDGLIPGFLHCSLMYWTGNLLPICLQCITRGDIRRHFSIQGSACEDFLCSCCCMTCSLVQESAQLKRNVPMVRTGLYYPPLEVHNTMMMGCEYY